MRSLLLTVSLIMALASLSYSQYASLGDYVEPARYKIASTVLSPSQQDDTWKQDYKNLYRKGSAKQSLGTILIAISTVATATLIATDTSQKEAYYGSEAVGLIGFFTMSTGQAQLTQAHRMLVDHL